MILFLWYWLKYLKVLLKLATSTLITPANVLIYLPDRDKYYDYRHHADYVWVHRQCFLLKNVKASTQKPGTLRILI